MSEKPPFPLLKNLPANQIPATHCVVQVTPAAAPELAYQVTIRKNWQRGSTGDAKPLRLGEVARIGLFSDAAPPAALLQFSCCRMDVEVPVMDYLHVQAQAFGLRMIESRLLNDGPGEAYEATAWHGSQSNPNIARVLCRADGGTIYILLAIAPPGLYERLAEDFALALGSFAPLRSIARGQLEPWEAVVVDEPKFRMARPKSWAAAARPALAPGKGAAELFLTAANNPELRVGYIRVKAIDRSIEDVAVDALIQGAERELAQSATSLTGGWALDMDPLIKTTPHLLSAVRAAGTSNGLPVDLRIVVMDRDSLRFCATMMAVQKPDDMVLWMRGKRAFMIAVRSATPFK